MSDNMDRRAEDVGRRIEDAKCAVLHERVTQLERRCDKKDIKIDALQAFQNRALGYAMAASAVAAFAFQYFSQNGG